MYKVILFLSILSRFFLGKVLLMIFFIYCFVLFVVVGVYFFRCNWCKLLFSDVMDVMFLVNVDFWIVFFLSKCCLCISRFFFFKLFNKSLGVLGCENR